MSISLSTVLAYLREADLDSNQRVEGGFRNAEMTLAVHNARADQQFEVGDFIKFFGLFKESTGQSSYSHQDVVNFAALSGRPDEIEASDLDAALQGVQWVDGQNSQRDANYLRSAITTRFKKNELVTAINNPTVMAQVDTNPTSFNVPIDDVLMVAQEVELITRSRSFNEPVDDHLNLYIGQVGADSYEGRIAAALLYFHNTVFKKYDAVAGSDREFLGFLRNMAALDPNGNHKFLTADEINRFDAQVYTPDSKQFLSNIIALAWGDKNTTSNIDRRFYETQNFDVVQLSGEQRRAWENQYKQAARKLGDAALVPVTDGFVAPTTPQAQAFPGADLPAPNPTPAPVSSCASTPVSATAVVAQPTETVAEVAEVADQPLTTTAGLQQEVNAVADAATMLENTQDISPTDKQAMVRELIGIIKDILAIVQAMIAALR
ncbi:MAG: hypothetical protein R2857_14030 [Vampirovibrionales bacterium]